MGKTYSHSPDEDYVPDNEHDLSAVDPINAWVDSHTSNSLERLVLKEHLYYEGKGRKMHEPSPSEHDGIDFYRVGHNASHEFYLGTKDGKLYQGSFGDTYVGPEGGCDCFERSFQAWKAWQAEGNKGGLHRCPEADKIEFRCEQEHWDDRFTYREIDPRNIGYIGHY